MKRNFTFNREYKRRSLSSVLEETVRSLMKGVKMRSIKWVLVEDVK